MLELSLLAPDYIERNKVRLLQMYYNWHSEGAVILLFRDDVSIYDPCFLCESYFLTKSEIRNSSTLPSNAYSEAQEYWMNNPRQLVFLSWYYPITPGTPFNVYCLGTIIQTLTPEEANWRLNEDLNRKHREEQRSNEDAWGCLFFFGGLFLFGLLIVIIGSLA